MSNLAATTSSEMHKHTFELSGMGKAPFIVVEPKTHPVEAGCVFWCEHCGTQLKNRFFVKSADGKVSIVGIDCLNKTGDAGLIDGAKRLIKASKAELKQSKGEQLAAAREAKERLQNNGLTNWELSEKIRLEIESASSEFAKMIEENAVLKSLTQHGFEISMKHKALLGEPYSVGMLSVIKEIHAKKLSKAKKGSAAYKLALDVATNEVDALQETIEQFKAGIEGKKTMRAALLCWAN